MPFSSVALYYLYHHNDYLSCIFGRRPFLAFFFHLPRGLLFLVGYAGRRLLFIVFSLAFFFSTALSIALGGIFDPHYDNFLELLQILLNCYYIYEANV